MENIVYRLLDEPNRIGLDWATIWEGPDRGLIRCWETGRTRAQHEPELAAACLSGALPSLGWKGGVTKRLKKLEKFGSLKYLAEWQGLRGEDLCIDLSKEITVTCTATGMIVTFTSDLSKLASQSMDEEAYING